MHPWHDLPLDEPLEHGFRMVTVNPAGSSLEYIINEHDGLVQLRGTLHGNRHFPTNHGIVPRACAGDGRPLDMLVLLQREVAPRTLVRVRAIGVVDGKEDGGLRRWLLGVALDDPEYAHYGDAAELPPHIRVEIGRFVDETPGPTDSLPEVRGAFEALVELREAASRYRDADVP
jgi:inorganic pyrophosphatase